MSAHTLHIPFTQPLSPGSFLFGRAVADKAFPFSAPRARYYYLARNGIFHGVDALGLKPGDTVLMPAYHHGVEVEVLKHKGLNLVYYRIDEKMMIDIDHLETLMNEDVRLLYVIHYLGFPQRMEKLVEFASRHGIAVFEDCALSLFSATADGRPLGSFGDVSIFCLYKTIPVPHGGIMLLNSPELELPQEPETPDWASTTGYIANRLIDYVDLNWSTPGQGISFMLRTLGRTFKRTSGIKAVPIDTNSFEEYVVALGISNMTHRILDRVDAERVVQKRRNNFVYLADRLAGKVRMQFTDLPDGTCPLSLPILARDKVGVYESLLEEGIETVTLWSIDNPEIPVGTFPEVDFLRRHVLELPVHQELRKKHLDYIAAKVAEHGRW